MSDAQEPGWLTSKELATLVGLDESHLRVVLRALDLQNAEGEPSQKALDAGLGCHEVEEITRGLRMQTGETRWHPKRTPEFFEQAGLQQMEGGDDLFVSAARITCYMEMAGQHANAGDDTKATISLQKAMTHLRRGLSGDQRPHTPRYERSQVNDRRAARLFSLLVQTFGQRQSFIETMMTTEGANMESVRRRLLTEEAAHVRKGLVDSDEGARNLLRM